MSGLTSRVLSSLGWVFTNIATKNLIQFARMFVLWKILSPRDFGLNAFAWLVLNGFQLLQDLGFRNALIQRKTDLEAAVSVTWYANVAFRSLIYGAVFLLAPAFAEHFKEPVVASILRIASITILLGALGNANEALLQKDFRQKRLLVVDAAENVVLTVVQIALALAGLGVWSLAWGAVGGALARSLLLWWFAPIRVGRLDLRVAREMWRYGMHMSLSTLGIWLIKNMDYYFVGKFFRAEALGFYTLAFKLSDLIAVNVVRLLGSVLFPAFAAIGHDLGRVRGAWLRAERYSMLLVVPMGVSLMSFAPEIVGAFFERGAGTVEVPMAILTVFALCRGIGVPLGDVSKGIGKPWILTRVVTWHVIALAPALYAVCAYAAARGIEMRWALVAVSCTVAACAVFAIATSLLLTSREVKYTARQVVTALGPSFACGLVMAGAVWLGRKGLLALLPDLPPIAVLAILGPIALAAYALALLALFPGVVKEMRGLLEKQRATLRERAQRRAERDGAPAGKVG
ncbi:MAG: lipopolysaccharide biosynthesis protein [Planctomycetes bacterium]|nr:lipopolysaccharide biosynthesis protein [Planctomycetota bacterium]